MVEPLDIIAHARAYLRCPDSLAASHRALAEAWPDWSGGSVASFAAKLEASAARCKPSPLALVPVACFAEMCDGETYLCARLGDTTGLFKLHHGSPAIGTTGKHGLEGYELFFRIERSREHLGH